MIDKVKNFVKENKLLEKNDKVLVALSGGPDSICLMDILYSLKDEFKLTLAAVHVNHLLRGEEALKDEEYVQKFCAERGISCYINRINIEAISKERGISHEMAGREERYSLFQTIKNEAGYNKIAIAHNANDQAETVIMRMMRGTGLEGITGIRVKRDGGIIRPILCLKRKEIEEYCKEKKLEPRIDRSNLEKVYSRNKIRLDILPYMKKNFNEEIIDTINRMVSLLQKDNDFIESESDKAFNTYCQEQKESLVIKKDLFNMHEAIATRVIKKAFINYSKKYSNFEMKHIYDVLNLASNSTNKRIDLPNNIIAENIYGDIYLKCKMNINDKDNKNDIILIKKEELENNNVEFKGYIVTFEILNCKNNIQFLNNPLIKYFDYDNILEEVCIRNRKNGDKIRPLGMKGNQKLKDIFINMKVPKEIRDSIPILCFDNNIGWVVGYKVSQDFKVDQKTKKVLKITFTRKE